MTKRIAVPICWAIYKVHNDQELLTLIGNTPSEHPPAILMEAMVFNGRAKRETIIHTLHISDVEEEDDETTGEDGLWGDDET